MERFLLNIYNEGIAIFQNFLYCWSSMFPTLLKVVLKNQEFPKKRLFNESHKDDEVTPNIMKLKDKQKERNQNHSHSPKYIDFPIKSPN